MAARVLRAAARLAPPPPAAAAAAAAAGRRLAATAAGPGSPLVSIDRSGLFSEEADASTSASSSSSTAHKERETPMARHIQGLIRFRGGPITLAEYMGECLTNPRAGYYVTQKVFGAGGDFTTSPEVSQLFGEAVGAWAAASWAAAGRPAALRLVELGPGRGTLMADLLRATAPLAGFAAALRVALVEVSPALRAAQWAALHCAGAWAPEKEVGVSAFGGVRVSWHAALDELPAAAPAGGPTLYVCNEFLDALPVHQFERTAKGWCERLVAAAEPASPLHLRLVLSPGPTPAARAVLPRRLASLPLAARAALRELEVCPRGMALAEALGARVAEHGGAALLIDYGRDAPYGSSLQAIREHRFVPILERPGEADLSARVDFAALRAAAEAAGAAAHGPAPQGELLVRLGARERLQRLVEAASTEEEAAALVAGYRRLVGGAARSAAKPVSAGGGRKAAAAAAAAAIAEAAAAAAAGGGSEEEPEGMGHSYQALAIGPRGGPPPVGFGDG
jgi:NADH dehydrogenase [ubiquinone] 1 alpha subcomplex assembly factor 7